jgi:hypothetical protein
MDFKAVTNLCLWNPSNLLRTLYNVIKNHTTGVITDQNKAIEQHYGFDTDSQNEDDSWEEMW